MIAALFLLLLLHAAAPAGSSAPAAPSAPARAQVAREDFPTLFLFYRLRYFHDVAALRRCRRAEPDRAGALDARYDALHRRLIERFGAATIDMPGSDRLERGEDPDCRMGFTLMGYANALNEMERHLPGAGR
jgi:hypothetical protein